MSHYTLNDLICVNGKPQFDTNFPTCGVGLPGTTESDFISEMTNTKKPAYKSNFPLQNDNNGCLVKPMSAIGMQAMHQIKFKCKTLDIKEPEDYDAAAHDLFASLGMTKPVEIQNYNHADVVY